MRNLRNSATPVCTAVVFISLLAARDLAAQALRVTIELSKSEFFEGEPVYALATLANISPDTAWTAPFHFASQALRMSLIRKAGAPVAYHGIVADLRFGPAWRGMPLPPGAQALESVVLQSWWGVPEERGLFLDELGPGEYVLSAAFDAYQSIPEAAPLLIEADPVAFRIRSRTPPEDRVFRDVQRIGAMAWTPHRSSEYGRALLTWTDSALTQDPENPYIPYLLNQGVQTAHALGLRFGSTGVVKLRALRLRAVPQIERSLPSFAVLVQAISSDQPDSLAALVDRFRGRPAAGIVAFYK